MYMCVHMQSSFAIRLACCGKSIFRLRISELCMYVCTYMCSRSFAWPCIVVCVWEIKPTVALKCNQFCPYAFAYIKYIHTYIKYIQPHINIILVLLLYWPALFRAPLHAHTFIHTYIFTLFFRLCCFIQLPPYTMYICIIIQVHTYIHMYVHDIFVSINVRPNK